MLDQRTLHRRACRVLPACLHTEAVIAATTDDGRPPAGDRALATLLLPLRHVHRGWVWFRLASETCAALRARPMTFLQDATRAREGLSRHGTPIVWGPWRLAGSDAPRACRYMACSRDGRARLWVLPEPGIVAYAWDDHRGPRMEESGGCR